MTSSFVYDRFTQFGFGSEPSERTRARARYYTTLFKLRYLEVSSGRPSYPFFKPVLRIVALEGNGERLAEIATALRRRAPSSAPVWSIPSRSRPCVIDGTKRCAFLHDLGRA